MFINMEKAVKKYGENEAVIYALQEASMNLEEGEIGVVLGPSGSGKSTLLNMIGGLDTLDEGVITIGGRNISQYNADQLTEFRREDVGFVFQFYNLIPDLTVYENIEVVKDISGNPLDIDEVVKALEITGLQDRFPKELSGGQQQRVAIARALVKNPKLLLCDELTGALDSKSSRDILKFIEKVNGEFNTTILIITHNEVIQNMADRIIKVKDGKVVSNEVNSHKLKAEELEL